MSATRTWSLSEWARTGSEEKRRKLGFNGKEEFTVKRREMEEEEEST